MEKDRGDDWPGIEVEKLSAWMLEQISEQVDLPLERESEAVDDRPGVAPKGGARPSILIEQVQFFQPASASAPVFRVDAGQRLIGRLDGDQPFRLVVDFTLSGEAARQIPIEGIRCRARCFGYDNAAKASALLAETPLLSLESGKLEYTYELPKVSLASGEYRMWVLVIIPQAGRLTPDFLELPLLIVA